MTTKQNETQATNQAPQKANGAPMMIKLKPRLYGQHISQYAGQWLEVDTSHLFANQYNTTAPSNLRVMDADIEEVKNDKRAGVVTCKYCGEQFASVADYMKHCEEEEAQAGKDCAGCWWYQEHIDKIERTKETTREEVNEAGQRVKISEEVTRYIYTAKKCEYKENERTTCKHTQHRAHGFEIFTAKNCYFLKYPRGYINYFKELTTGEKWQELGYMWNESTQEATKAEPVGTYYPTLKYKDGALNMIIFRNARNTYTLTNEDIKRISDPGYYSIEWRLKYSDEVVACKCVARNYGIENAGATVKPLMFAYIEQLKEKARTAEYNEVLKIINNKEVKA